VKCFHRNDERGGGAGPVAAVYDPEGGAGVVGTGLTGFSGLLDYWITRLLMRSLTAFFRVAFRYSFQSGTDEIL
jgi:hypothetical protein